MRFRRRDSSWWKVTFRPRNQNHDITPGMAVVSVWDELVCPPCQLAGREPAMQPSVFGRLGEATLRLLTIV